MENVGEGEWSWVCAREGGVCGRDSGRGETERVMVKVSDGDSTVLKNSQNVVLYHEMTGSSSGTM